MAPVNSAKALQQNRTRPAVPKQVVPAIPLTFGQRRQKQQPARAKPEDVADPASPAVVGEARPPSPQATDSTVVANGAPGSGPADISEEANASTESSVPVTPATENEATGDALPQRDASVHENEKTQETARSTPSVTTSSASRSTYQMPPAFVPSDPAQPPTVSSESVKFPPQPNFNGQSPMHHAHHSAGSITFGGYPESSNSSPAPPQSAGNIPPYPYPQQQPRLAVGRPPHQTNGGLTHTMSNGYSPMGPPPPGYYPHMESNMAPGVDTYARRQLISFAPPDGYSPSSTPLGAEGHRLNAYDPPTPHSFHGSQSSAPSEQENGPAFFGQFPTAVISNGSNGHIDDVRVYHQQRPKIHPSAQNSLAPQQPAQPLMPVDTLDGLVNYVQHQFNISEFADYVVELRYADDRFPPERVHGHGLMFARSPTLKALMTSLKRENHGDRTLLIQSNDRFVRPDAFWMALHRLYGGPLLDMDTLAPMNSVSHNPLSVQNPGTSTDRFDLALGYAAAGRILQIPPVVTRGVEIACTLVQWDTLEKAFDFALDGGLDAQWIQESAHEQSETPSTYGPSVNMLIQCALNFIVTLFPPDFELDGTVDDFVYNRRLPAIHQDRPNAPDRRLQSLRFGDFSTQGNSLASNASSTTAILSKVLLNLPFHLLKYILEFRRLGNVEHWATVKLRQKVMNAVVEEREKRRVGVCNNTHISNAERQQNHAAWQAVGWQEHVELQGGNEGIPLLARKWVDYRLPVPQD